MNHEFNLFDHQLYKEGYQSQIKLAETFEEFQKAMFTKQVFLYEYATNEAGFSFLIVLVHVYFKTPLLPNRWRKLSLKS
jgi:hypothetical protein